MIARQALRCRSTWHSVFSSPPRIAIIRPRCARMRVLSEKSPDNRAAAPSESATHSLTTEELELYQDAIIERLIPTPPPSLASVSLTGYASLHLLNLLCAFGLLFGVCLAPHLLIIDDSVASMGASFMMLGLVACAFLRSSAVLHFLVQSVANEEVMTWRHQRLSLSLGITSAITTIASLAALLLSPATPLLATALLATSAPTAALCLFTSFQAMRTAELFCWSVDHTRPFYTLKKLSSCFLHGISNLPGLICIAIMAVSCLGAVAGFVPSGLGPPLHSQYECLRLMAASSMIVSIFYFHELLEFTPWATERDAPSFASQALLLNMYNMAQGKHSRVNTALNPPPDRYLWFNATTLVASVAQSVFLSKAHEWDAMTVLNQDPFWGCIFYSTGLMLAYSTTLAAYLNYNTISGLFSWLSYQVASIIAFLFDNIIYKWKFQSKMR